MTSSSSFFSFLLVYTLGGITFIPLVAASLFLYVYHTATQPVPSELPQEASLKRPADDEDEVFQTNDEKLIKRLVNSADVAAGYFAVTREFVPGGVNGKPPERVSPAGTSSYSDSPSVYQSVYRSLFEKKGNVSSSNAAKGRAKRGRNEFFVVLRHGHLMLYDDADETDVRHVISLSNYNVSIYGGGKKAILEGELYIRRNAIRLSRKTIAVDPSVDQSSESTPFYLFTDNCSLKEDFYLALIRHQDKDPDDPSIPPRPLRYQQEDIIRLVQRLHSSEENLAMNWVNGLLGRIFLSVYKTPEMEQFIKNKIAKKISRVNKPNFLSDIVLQHIYIGDGAPFLTNPRLKEMTAEGDLCVEADVTYTGNFRLRIATKATMNLGARFKPREVNLVLAVVLKRLDGHALIRIKPPPSNRLWFSFEKMPEMQISIEPIVGSTQVAWGPILRIIEGRIREVVAETVVLPHYDDIPFMDTIKQKFRGGIWEEPRKRRKKSATPPSKEEMLKEAEKELNKESRDTPKELESSTPTVDRTLSMPSIPSSPPKVGGKKAASVIGISDAAKGGAEIERSPSIKATSSGKKSKSQRTQSLNSIAPSAAIVSTDTVNITAHRSGVDTEIGDATSAVMAIRSRSSSSAHSSPSLHAGSPERTRNWDIDSPDHTPTKRPNNGTVSERIDTAENSGDESLVGTASIPSITPVGSISGGSTRSLGSTTSQPSATSSSPRTPAEKGTAPSEKASIAALTTATTAVKNWYKNRNSASNDLKDQANRKLPPAKIPTPPQKRSTPIDMPKRKSLPPPVLPQRRSRNGSAPPLPPRKNISHDTLNEVLVVAAPDSEPTSPNSESSTQRDPADSSAGTPPVESPKRVREGSESWERKNMRERAEEESELWHPAEEENMRNRVPWEPDEL